MGIEYQIRLRSPAGEPVEFFDLVNEDRFYYELRLNKPGLFQLRLNGNDSRRGAFTLDAQLEAWWHDPEAGIGWSCDGEFFCKSFNAYTDDKGIRWYMVSGPGYLSMVEKVLVLPSSGDVTSISAIAADTAISTLVENNAGPSAAVARRKSGLTVQAGAGTASPVSRSVRRNEYLLKICQDLAAAARQIGVGVDFEMVGPGRDSSLGNAQFKFKLGVPYLGQDKTVGDDRVVFAEQRDNMRRPSLKIDRTKEITRVYVAGPGEGANKIIEEVASADEGDSAWNRRESWLDTHDQAEQAQRTTLAQAHLRKNRAVTSFDFEPIETQATRYGRDWGLGTRVVGRYDGADYNIQCVGLKIDVTARSNDNVRRIDVEWADA